MTGQRRRVPTRRVVVVAGLITLVVALVLPVVLMAARVYPPRRPVGDSPDRLGLSFEDVVIRTDDGVELHGWYLPPAKPTGRAVVLAHGIDDNRLQSGVALPLAAALVERGFAVLLFDMRGSGDSGTAAQTLGAHEARDVLAGVDLVRSRGADRVGVIGFSMGAVASIQAMADGGAVDALVTDSAYADLHETLVRGMGRSFLVPAPLAEYPLLWFRILSGVEAWSVRPIDVVGRIAPRPMLIIHGSADEAVDPGDSKRLLEAARNPNAARWLVPGGRHTLSYEAAPGEYVRRVVDFFESSL